MSFPPKAAAASNALHSQKERISSSKHDYTAHALPLILGTIKPYFKSISHDRTVQSDPPAVKTNRPS